MTEYDEDSVSAVRIPADISRPDRLLGPFTARQTALLAVAALVLYGGYWATRPLLAPLAYAVMAIPIAGAVAALVLGQREGVALDRLLVAALTHTRTRGRKVHAPEGVPPLPGVVPARWAVAAGRPAGVMDMPYDGVTTGGVLDLGGDGHAALARCSTVNFDLRSGAEQQGLTAGFARWLNSLTGPTQLLVRCHRIDLAPLAEGLHHHAPTLPHPALEQAARAHADFLARLASGGDLLGRQITLVAREGAALRGGRGMGEGRALQRLQEAARALAPAEITVSPLDAAGAAGLITAACNPDGPGSPDGQYGPDAPIASGPEGDQS